METRESLRDATGAVFHVDYNEVVAGETGDLSECRREREQEKTIQSLAIFQARFEGLWGGGGS